MNKTITSSTYIRNLNFSILRKLSDFLDPHDKWKEVLLSIEKTTGEPRYTQHHVRRFEALAVQGRSPTIELLSDWGTTNCTVGDLVDILKSHMLLAPATLLLPDAKIEPIGLSVGPQQQACQVVHTDNNFPTSRVGEEDMPLPLVSVGRPHQHPETTEKGDEPDIIAYSSFSYHELMKITGNFDDRPTSEGGNRLGEGGFGTVYKGFINDKSVAVKKLRSEVDMLGEDLQLQFHQEIQTLKTLKHKNLVDMVGFSSDGQYPCLVYVYMANGSVLDRLACLDGSPPLSWQRRSMIATESARGLEYLHSNHHVHRDIKSGNILLDENYVVKISDFGLTRASAKRSATTMMTERIVGTRAYMAPEALRGEITPRSDIFSFGVVLLEILSGLPPVDENRDPPFLMELRYDIDDEDEDLTLEDFLDKKMSDMDMSQVERTYTMACSCLHERKSRRPTINQVLSELEEVLKSF